MLATEATSQEILRRIEQGGRNLGNKQIIGGENTDSLRRRDKFADSLTIHFRYLDSAGQYKLDSSLNDHTTWFPVPAHHVHLGNTGTATHSLLFQPSMQPGWNSGFNSYDVYKWKLSDVRFFNTTRPYTQLGYMVGSRTEQLINVFHTQNIKPHWNASLGYRMINSPGFFKSQKTNHNNYLLTSLYDGPSKRYHNYFVLLANNMQSAENGGIVDNSYLDHPDYTDRFSIPTKLGGDPEFGRDFFGTQVTTGNKHKEFTALMRQQYDLGRKDSLVTDSTVIPLFYPRLRFEHTIQYNRYDYLFRDAIPDSAYYNDHYKINLAPLNDSVVLQDKWHQVINDFSIYTFPDANNLQQYLKLGLSMQNMQGVLKNGKSNFYNLIGHGIYRNKTRNGKWDMEASGKLFFTGFNAGDYHAYGSLQRQLSSKLGFLKLGFENSNKSPSFLFNNRSSFYLDTIKDFNKENISHAFAEYFLPNLKLKLEGHYYLISNYSYLNGFFELAQESSLFNYLQVSLQKQFTIGKSWNWYTDVYLQKETGNPPVNLPLFFTRQRFAYEGNFGFKNLNISIGTELKYHTPYKADGYSPLLSNFFFQDTATITNRPEIAAYMHFRIRSFKAYIRAENLNTVSTQNGFGFTRNNFSAPGYPTPGMIIRVGIFWTFVN